MSSTAGSALKASLNARTPRQRLLYRGLAATVLVESLLRPRALLARAHCDEAAYRDFVEPYRVMATSLGFEGHMSTTDAMT